MQLLLHDNMGGVETGTVFGMCPSYPLQFFDIGRFCSKSTHCCTWLVGMYARFHLGCWARGSCTASVWERRSQGDCTLATVVALGPGGDWVLYAGMYWKVVPYLSYDVQSKMQSMIYMLDGRW